MKVLLGFNWGQSKAFGRAWYTQWINRLRGAGIDVTPYCLTLAPPGDRLGWRELDRRWRRGDRELLGMYEGLAEALEGYDCFVNFNGINLHPEFVQQLPVRTVYGCFDDPEASEDLSRPVASAYDVAMVGNVAELDRYRSWGVKSVHWWPLGFRAEDFDPTLDEARIRSSARDVDVALLCERVTRYRRARVDRFALAFPDGVYRGQGWPQGFLAESERVPLLQRTRIGINIHNSTGPINFRTFYLPANGVMQICDNKSHLASVFALGEEVVGYDTIDEAIDLCRFYLTHEQERQEIAIAGWKRTLRDYNEVAVFRRVFAAIKSLEAGDATRVRAPDIGAVRLALSSHATRTRARRLLHTAVAPISVTTKALVRASRSTARNALKLLDDRRARTEHARASATRTAGADSGATNA